MVPEWRLISRPSYTFRHSHVVAQQIGGDSVLVFKLTKLLKETPLPSTVVEALIPIAELDLIDIDCIEFIASVSAPCPACTVPCQGPIRRPSEARPNTP